MKSQKLYVVNYADPKFEHARCVCSESARKVGKADEVLEYRPEDIAEFRAAHPDIFKYERGAGLWAWKPYVIYDALQKIEDGAWLFYCDSGAEIVNDVHLLIRQAEADGEDRMTFQLLWATPRQYTKAETLKWMGCTDIDRPQVLATFSLWKKTAENMTIIKEWLDACCEERLISPARFDETIPQDPKFISHREDQSLFDVVVHRHGIRPYRDPSDYGVRSYFWKPLLPVEHKSDYPVITLSFRRNDAVAYKKAFEQRYRFWKLCCKHYGIYNRAKRILFRVGLLCPEVKGVGI